MPNVGLSTLCERRSLYVFSSERISLMSMHLLLAFVRVGSHMKLEMVAEDKQGGVPSYKDDTAFTIVESSNQHTML